MRKRITRALLATAAAGATITSLGFAAAGAAGASTGHGVNAAPRGHGLVHAPSAPVITTDQTCTATGSPTDNCARAGYQATGRTFRYAQALMVVPNIPAGGGDVTADPQVYVALDNSQASQTFTYVRAGVSPCSTNPGEFPQCPVGNTSGWVGFVEAQRFGTMVFFDSFNLSAAFVGDRIFASVYEEPTGNVVDANIRTPDGVNHPYAVGLSGATFHRAQALADWENTHANGAATAPVFATLVKYRVTQFFQGAFTTMNGDHGTFHGPWALEAPEVTSNGTAAGTLVAEPSFLWNDGMGNGWGDAFGVWVFPF